MVLPYNPRAGSLRRKAATAATSETERVSPRAGLEPARGGSLSPDAMVRNTGAGFNTFRVTFSLATSAATD